MAATPRNRLDVEDTQRRMRELAESAKRLEEDGRGWDANAAWVRYEELKSALAAQERRAAARRLLHG